MQGRFICADSVGGSVLNPQTLNRYAYTGNNPVNNIDPSGHSFFSAQFNGGGFDYGQPDNAGSLPGYLQSEISRIKEVIYDSLYKVTEAASYAHQQNRRPGPPPPLTQQQIDAGMASAANYGPMVPERQWTQGEATQVRGQIETLLSTPGCEEFIDSLFKAVGSGESPDILGGFDAINSPTNKFGGFYFADISASGTTSGALEYRNARVVLDTGTSMLDMGTNLRYAGAFTLHEIIHCLTQFGDEALARAVHRMEHGTRPLPNVDPKIPYSGHAYSNYWNDALYKACGMGGF